MLLLRFDQPRPWPGDPPPPVYINPEHVTGVQATIHDVPNDRGIRQQSMLTDIATVDGRLWTVTDPVEDVLVMLVTAGTDSGATTRRRGRR